MSKKYVEVTETYNHTDTGVPFSLTMITENDKQRAALIVAQKAFEKWQKDNPEIIEKLFNEV